MRSEDSLYEWEIKLRSDGKIFIAFEGIDGAGGAGVLADSDKDRDQFLKLAFGSNFEEEVEKLKESLRQS